LLTRLFIIEIYGIDESLSSSFLPNIQAILREMASLAVDLNASPELKMESTGPISRVAATLNLSYHQVSSLP
jgi:hypothetical protein